MKNKIFNASFFSAILFGTFLIWNIEPTKGQIPEPVKSNESKVKMTGSSSAFYSVASENARLKNDLTWTFGKKTQRGWNLYIYLLQSTLETDKAPESAEFAQEVSNWQKKNGLIPNGRLDETTLFSFIKFWQSRRLNSSLYPSDDQLITAPIENFYDPTRSPELLKVEKQAFEAYQKMIAAAIADKTLKLKSKNGKLAPEESYLKIISSFRSREYQAELRKKSPQSGSAGLATNSPHFTGCALDIYVGGEPVSTKDENRAVQIETPVYKWLVKNAAKYGFYPYYYEPWHWEYVPKK